MPSLSPNTGSRRKVPRLPTLLFLLGAILGIFLAASDLGLVAPGREPLPAGAVARVNDEWIALSAYTRLVTGETGRRGEPPSAAERRRILSGLVDEELLVQRALELGFARNDRRVRADLTRAVVDSILADTHDVAPDEKTLRAFYEKNAEAFAEPGPMRVEALFFRLPTTPEEPPALPRALQARKRLGAGEDLAAVGKEIGDPLPAPIPDELLPAERMSELIAPAAVDTLGTLEPGRVSPPIRTSSGYFVARVVERGPDEIPPFEEVRGKVLVAWRREESERAVREYLADLRERAEVEIREPLP